MRILVAATALLLGACGFHLQGREGLPASFAYTYIDAKNNNRLFAGDQEGRVVSIVVPAVAGVR